MTRKTLWLLLSSTVLLCVFTLYLQPDFMVQMANQLWACF